MAITFRGPTDLLFVLSLILLGFQSTQESGRAEIHFLKYTASCVENFVLGTSLCDPKFSLCLGIVQNEPLSVANCKYASVGESDHFHDTNYIDFEHMTDMGGLANPWKVYMFRFEAASIMLVVEIRDADLISSDDYLQTLGIELWEKVWRSESQSEWTEHTMSKNGYSIDFSSRFYCDPNYYTSSCDKYCEPQNSELGHYTCHPGTGDKICMAGWRDERCSTDIDECALGYCVRGSCANLPGDYLCLCPPGYTGKNCSIALDPCHSQPCWNGGACFSSHDEYVCMCTDGWEGDNCEARSDPCNKKPCSNGGSCHSSPDKTTYQCVCVYPYTGYHCQSISSTTRTTTTTSTSTTKEARTTTTTTGKPTISKTTSRSTSSQPATRQTTTAASITTMFKKASSFGPAIGNLGINSSGESSGDGFQTWHGLLIGFILLIAFIACIGLLVWFLKKRQRIPYAHTRPGHDSDTIRNGVVNPLFADNRHYNDPDEPGPSNGSETQPKTPATRGRPALSAITNEEHTVSVHRQPSQSLDIVNPSEPSTESVSC